VKERRASDCRPGQPTDCHGQENEAGETIYQFPSNSERPLCHRTASRRPGRIMSPRELELMKELVAAGRQGRTVLAANRFGLARMIEKHYVKTSLVGVHGVRYVITRRGRQALADEMKTVSHA